MRKGVILFLIFTIWFVSANAQKQKDQNVDPPTQVVYVVALKGKIFQGLARSVLQKLKRVDKTKAKIVIIEIDTPGGGDTKLAIDICREIDYLAESSVPVYAYITEAKGGGALVALACDRIYMISKGTIGVAKDAEEEDIEILKKEFKEYAKKRSYPISLAEAMVDPNLEVSEIIYRGDRQFKTTEELVEMRNDPDKNEHIVEKGTIVAKNKLAEFSADQAKDLGFCRGGIFETRMGLLKSLNLDLNPIKELNVTSSDALANFLTNKFVRTMLIALGILGLLIEFWTPGFGIPGIAGLAFFGLFFLGGFLAEVAEIWEILVFVLGVGLIAVELFVLPGFGIIGILGIFCCFAGLLLSLQSFIFPSNENEVGEFMSNIYSLTFSVGIDIFAFIIIAKFLPEGAPLRRLSVATVQDTNEGYSVAVYRFSELEGQQGEVVSQLRPAGKMRIGEETYDVVAQGDFIEEGETVKVTSVQGNRIIVDKPVIPEER